MGIETQIIATLAQGQANTPYAFGTTDALLVQGAGPGQRDTEIAYLAVQVAFRACAGTDGTRRSVAACEDAEDSDVIYSDIIFPECISYGSTGSPIYMTDKIEVASGAESRNARWIYPKHEYNILMEEIPSDEIAKVMNIWHVCSGSHAGFLFLDPLDHTSRNDADNLSGSEVTPTDQLVGDAVGVLASYPLYKYYHHASREKQRRILYPQLDTLRVAVDGFECFNWNYSYTSHMLTFTLAFGATTKNLTKTGQVITGMDFSALQEGDLLYITGWTNGAYNFPQGGDPVRVVSASATELTLEKMDGSNYGPDSFGPESVTLLPTVPPTGSEITAGYYFYVPVRFGDDDDMESEITSGMRESAFATFESITLREIAE